MRGVADGQPERWTLPLSFQPVKGESSTHAILERGNEMIAVCGTSRTGPRLIACRQDRSLPGGLEMICLLNAVGGTGSMVIPRSLKNAAETANRILGGRPLTVHMPLRLYRYAGGVACEPDPCMRVARPSDAEILSEWFTAFSADTGLRAPDDMTTGTLKRIEAGRVRILEVDGTPVACAQMGTRTAGQIRIGLVYVPDAERRKGHAGRLVRSVTAEALEEDALVCLFTDAENTSTDALYQSIGFEPVEELLHLDPTPSESGT